MKGEIPMNEQQPDVPEQEELRSAYMETCVEIFGRLTFVKAKMAQLLDHDISTKAVTELEHFRLLTSRFFEILDELTVEKQSLSTKEIIIMESTTLTRTAQLFIEHLRDTGKKNRTLYTYRKDLDIVEAFFGGERPVCEIRVPQVGKFYKSQILLKTPDGKDRAERTITKTMRVFRMMMVWARNMSIITELPLPKNTPMGYSKTKDEGNDDQ